MALTSREGVLAELGVVALVALVAGSLGLFAPPGAPLGARVAFALAFCIAGWSLARILLIVGAATARLLGLNPLWGYCITIPVSSAVVAWAVLSFAVGQEAAFGEEFANVWPQTLLVGVGFFILFFILYGRKTSEDYSPAVTDQKSVSAAVDGPADVGVRDSALHEHLSPGFPPILALSVEDHYVRAIATNRTEMRLLPLAQATKLMPKGSGEQVNRSWWVARNVSPLIIDRAETCASDYTVVLRFLSVVRWRSNCATLVFSKALSAAGGASGLIQTNPVSL